MVWFHALSGPRYIDVRTANDEGQLVMYDRPEESYGDNIFFASIEKAPALFFTCQEARKKVQKFNQPLKVRSSTDNISFRFFKLLNPTYSALVPPFS